MENERNSPAQSAAASAEQQAQPVAITAELVREVVEKVYVLWLRELKIERERWRGSATQGWSQGGGWS